MVVIEAVRLDESLVSLWGPLLLVIANAIIALHAFYLLHVNLEFPL